MASSAGLLLRVPGRVGHTPGNEAGLRLGAALQHVEGGIWDGVPAQQVNLGHGRLLHRKIRDPDRMPIGGGSPVLALEGVRQTGLPVPKAWTTGLPPPSGISRTRPRLP
jgi:hypothetical protein